MTDAPAPSEKRNRILFFALATLLIGNFLWRMIVTADEYPPRSAQILEMVLHGGMVAGLIAIRKSGPQLLFIVALIAGIGLFGIRLHSEHSWWTGHWHYIFDKR